MWLPVPAFSSLTRQLGGSIGIAAITTLVAKQQFVHRAQLIYDVSDLNPAYPERLSANTAYFNSMSGDPVAVKNQALALIDHAVNTQAALLSYRDVFYFVALVFLPDPAPDSSAGQSCEAASTLRQNLTYEHIHPRR